MSRFAVASEVVVDGSTLDGREIQGLDLRRLTGVTIVAILSGDDTLMDPPPDTRISAGDEVVVVGLAPDLDRFQALASTAAEGP